jgi:hypothetical protein
MATREQEIAQALESFGDRAPAATVSALRTLAFIGLREAGAALKTGDYRRAQEAAFALLQTLEALDERDGKGG